MPHGQGWTPSLIVSHGASHPLIALPDLSIPITLAHFTRNARDIHFTRVFPCVTVEGPDQCWLRLKRAAPRQHLSWHLEEPE
jgi:hypothetical protein